MNFYDFHIGDYASRTAHLEPMEDLAYRRMLDLYYVRERALPFETADIARLIRLRGQEEAIEAVLHEFFENMEEGWVHRKCEAVIAAAQEKRTKAQASAAQRWAKDRNASALPTHSERTADALRSECEGNAPSPSPTTQSHKKPPKPPKGGDGLFEKFWDAYPRKVGRDKAERAFAKRNPDDALLSQMLQAIGWQSKREQWQKEEGKYIPHPSTWLNEGRWQDSRPGDTTAWHETRSGIETRGIELGIGPWNETEQFPAYKARVLREHEKGMH